MSRHFWLLRCGHSSCTEARTPLSTVGSARNHTPSTQMPTVPRRAPRLQPPHRHPSAGSHQSLSPHSFPSTSPSTLPTAAKTTLKSQLGPDQALQWLPRTLGRPAGSALYAQTRPPTLPPVLAWADPHPVSAEALPVVPEINKRPGCRLHLELPRPHTF